MKKRCPHLPTSLLGSKLDTMPKEELPAISDHFTNEKKRKRD